MSPLIYEEQLPVGRSSALITALALEGADGQFVPLLIPGRRHASTADGLVGLAARERVRPRPGRHGNLNTTRYRDSPPIVIEGELFGNTPDDAWAEYNAIAAVCAAAVDTDRALRWSGVLDLVEQRVRVASLSAPLLVAEDVIRYQLTLRPADSRSFSQAERLAGHGPVLLATNIIRNPSIEASISDISAGAYAGGSIVSAPARVAGGVSGDWCARMTAHAVPGANIQMYNTTGGVYATAPGEVWSFGQRFRAVSGAALVNGADANIGFKTAGGTAFITQLGTSPTVLTDGEWVYIILENKVAPPTAGAVYFAAHVTGVGTGDVVLEADQYIAVKGPELPSSYFDGDSPNGKWTGTPHASASELYDPGSTLASGGGGKTYPYTYPRTYAAAGGGLVNFTVSGTDRTPPVFELYGFLASPVIELVSTGEQVRINGNVDAGHHLVIDVDARQVRLDDGTVRNNLLDFEGSTWFDLPPGPQTVRLSASSFDGDAYLRVRFRDAYA